MRGLVSTAIVAASVFTSSVVAAVDPIVISGSKFFYKTNGTQFFIKGVAYQQDYSSNGTTSSGTDYDDPLADATACARDIPLLQELQTNTIRVYAINPDLDHSECMSMLADAGIYVVSDLSDPADSINRNDAAWNDDLYARYTSVIDAMQNYTNVLGFFAGNEVANSPNTTYASAFVKAAVRDMKAYIKEKNYRTIGVGYATADVETIRIQLADYFNCGEAADAIDFWGYNIYSWCGDSTYEESGYADRTAEFANYSVPAFFAEYGCNTVLPRTFSEVDAIYGTNMTPVWSGGIVYMYFQEANDYGLVSVSGSSASKLAGFTSYSSRIAGVTPTGVNSASYTPSNSAQNCPAVDTTVWDAVATPLPPTPNEELCSCMYDSLSCVVAASVSTDDYATLFNYVCGEDNAACNGINTNYTDGSFYGAYGMCNSTQQLAYALNYYASVHSTATGACSFGGSATSKAAVKATGTCSSLIAQAGTAGTGSVTSVPTGTGAGAADSTSTGSSSSSSKAAASGLVHHSTSFGAFNIGLYVFVAVFSGAMMIAL